MSSILVLLKDNNIKSTLIDNLNKYAIAIDEQNTLGQLIDKDVINYIKKYYAINEMLRHCE